MTFDTQAYNRLMWRSRRGMKELDLLLVPFLREPFLQLESSSQADFKALLEYEDQQLYTLLVKQIDIEDSPLKDIIMLIIEYARTASLPRC